MIHDGALERNRRVAWARYYAARADLEQVAWWAVELAEYADAIGGGLPPEMAEVAGLIAEHVSDHDRGLIRRYVRHRLGATVAA